jgi:tape measure domain-containing protein
MGNRILEYIIRAKDATKAAIESARSRISGLAGTIGSNLANIQAGFAMLGGVVRQFAGIATRAVREAFSFEKSLTDFKVLLGSIDQAKEHVASLKAFASKTPLTFGDLAGASKLLLSFGSAVGDIQPSLKMLGDISMGDAQKFQGLALVFAQVKSAGKLMGQDLLQMINQGFNPLAVIAEQTGASMSDLKDMMSEGAISFEMVEAAMRAATGEGGRFHNAMEEASKTGMGLQSTLQDNVSQALTTLGGAFTNVVKNGLEALIGKFQELNSDGTIARWAEMLKEKVDSAAEAVKALAERASGLGRALKIGWDFTGGAVVSGVKYVGSTIGGAIGATAGVAMNGGGWEAWKAAMAENQRDAAEALRNSWMYRDLAGWGAFGKEQKREETERREAEAKAAVERKKAAKERQEAAETETAAARTEAAAEAAKPPEQKKTVKELLAEAQAETEKAKTLKRLEKERPAAENAVDKAKADVEEAWTWYRDPNLVKKRRKAEKEQAKTERKWQRDFEKLKQKYGEDDWKNVDESKLSAKESAVRSVALAKEAEKEAKENLKKIQENTKKIAEDIGKALTVQA